MVKGGEEPRIALTWDDATPRAWDRWLSAAGQSTIEQSWAYGMAMAQTTPYNAIHTVVHDLLCSCCNRHET